MTVEPVAPAAETIVLIVSPLPAPEECVAPPPAPAVVVVAVEAAATPAAIAELPTVQLPIVQLPIVQLPPWPQELSVVALPPWAIAAPALRPPASSAKRLLQLLRVARLVTQVARAGAPEPRDRVAKRGARQLLIPLPLPGHGTQPDHGEGTGSAPGSGGSGVVSSVATMVLDFSLDQPSIRLLGAPEIMDGTPPDLPLERPD